MVPRRNSSDKQLVSGARTGEGKGLVIAHTLFRVDEMQLTLLIYIITANLALSRKLEMAFCFSCGKSVSVGEEKKRRHLLSNPNSRYVFGSCFFLGSHWSKFVGNIARTGTFVPIFECWN